MITFPLSPATKFTRLKPLSCVALAALGSVALMPHADAKNIDPAPQVAKRLLSLEQLVEGAVRESGPILVQAWGSGRVADMNVNPPIVCVEKAPCEAAPVEVIEVDLSGPQKNFGVVVTEHVITEADLAPVPPKPEDLKPRDIRKDEALYDLKPVKTPKELICARAAPPVAINPAFTTDLYQQLSKEEGNVFFSPYSISEAMAMVQVGAKENTAKELAMAMHFGDEVGIADRLLRLRQHVDRVVNRNGDELSIANALCVTGEAPLQNYQTLVRERFAGELFSGGLAEINAWVKDKTRGHIDKILEQLDPNSACVLLNAVYFKGNWKTSFDASNTGMDYFNTAAGKKVEAMMMAQRAHYHMASNDEWIAVELPYKGNSSMVLIMPAKADQFAAFEKGINEGFLKKVDEQLRAEAANQEIDLIVPKFKIATKYDLVDAMMALGVKDAFDMKKANFDAMYERSDIAIGQIKHKATLEMNEEGSVATAATAIEMRAKGIPEPKPIISFDRPFIVRIKENTTNTTLFMGRISDPTK